MNVVSPSSALMPPLKHVTSAYVRFMVNVEGRYSILTPELMVLTRRPNVGEISK